MCNQRARFARRTWPLVCQSAAFSLAAGCCMLAGCSEWPGSRREEPSTCRLIYDLV